jgi:type VI secretion system protein VasD
MQRWMSTHRRRTPATGPQILVGVLLTLAACSSSPPPPPPAPTLANVQLNATGDSNPTVDGQGAPVAVRIYQLASKSRFEGAEFYTLFNGDAAALGADPIAKDELILIPGKITSLKLTPTDAVHAIGVFAAFRDFSHATWRADCDLPAHQTTMITVTAGRDGIKLVAEQSKPVGH